MGHYLLMIGFGIIAGLAAAFSGLGGGFLMVPLLLFLGFSGQKAVGSSFLAISILSLSALIAHVRLSNVDYVTGLLLGTGGVIGAQVGALLVEQISTGSFRRIFACILLAMAAYLFFGK
ncbi:MAG TPA: sulfite exporter TauE/SafE family protein [Thermodesulfobacteriota bacterium]|nr:sulfite exporter TauE/SafE family protein [Deltaproteobacteria bacterium]HNU72921.1 sulfite exporter TauE/SafE family protein [Thermodesulfobacteriota bacterium]